MALRSGAGSDGSAHGPNMSGCPSRWLWQKTSAAVAKRWREASTTAHGHRRLPEPLVRGRVSLRSPSLREGRRVRGRPGAVAGRPAAGRRSRRSRGLFLAPVPHGRRFEAEEEEEEEKEMDKERVKSKLRSMKRRFGSRSVLGSS